MAPSAGWGAQLPVESAPAPHSGSESVQVVGAAAPESENAISVSAQPWVENASPGTGGAIWSPPQAARHSPTSRTSRRGTSRSLLEELRGRQVRGRRAGHAGRDVEAEVPVGERRLPDGRRDAADVVVEDV